MSTSLRHATHPFKFCTVEIVGTGYFCPFVVNALLTLLKIVGIVATIGINGMVVQFEDEGADTVEEKAVVRHHE